MRVAITGHKWFGAAVFEAVREAGHTIAGVAAPSNGDQLALAAKRNDVPLQIHGARVEESDLPFCDVALAAHCHAFISEGARAKARLGVLGYHPSLLPLHRGRDAILWAIRMRETVTGGTIYYLDDGADTGDIAAQDWCFIRGGDTARLLWERDLAPMGIRLFARALSELESGKGRRVRQDAALATFEPSFKCGLLGRGR